MILFFGRGVCSPVVNPVRITHNKYIKLEKISSHPEKILEQMPTLINVLSIIDDQSHYQGVMFKSIERKKYSLERNLSCLIHDIMFWAKIGDEAHKDATKTVKETTEGGSLLSHIC